ncbi:MAG: OmpA family protein [Acidobacteria bacterium]|nr:OmpA family protein [Acidobacteriota bacterium]
MSDQAKEAPIIIIKKKGGHGGHHGGAWKVAYADFVTAMMAFFMVMWLMNAGEKVKESVAGYFNDPTGYKGSPGSGAAGTGDGLSITKDEMPDLQKKLEQALKEMPKFEEMKDNIKFTVTGEGLRIELLETENGMFFGSGSPNPSKEGRELLEKMAEELGKMPNAVLIEGHTDSKPFSGQGYTNWELSADRANMSRKVMQNAGLRSDQVLQVRGFADQRLFKKEDPTDASNRRISIIVQYKVPQQEEEGEGEEKKEGEKAEGAKEEKAGKPDGEKDAKPAKAEQKGAEKPAEKPSAAEKGGETKAAAAKPKAAKGKGAKGKGAKEKTGSEESAAKH